VLRLSRSEFCPGLSTRMSRRLCTTQSVSRVYPRSAEAAWTS